MNKSSTRNAHTEVFARALTAPTEGVRPKSLPPFHPIIVLPWYADLPTHFDRPNSHWQRYNRSCQTGPWQKIAETLRDERGRQRRC